MNRAVLAMVALMAAIAAGEAAAPQTPPPFDVQEASIAQIHAAMKAGRLNCRALVEQYLRRIDAFDKQGPAINAIVLINPEAGKLADDLDRRFAASGFVGPLHCVPMIVKDNFETIDLQSANGSLALAGFVAEKDAFQVKRGVDRVTSRGLPSAPRRLRSPARTRRASGSRCASAGCCRS
jgi:hypothetical protein